MPVIIDAAILELVMKPLYLFRPARRAAAVLLLAAPAAAGVNPGIPVTNPDTVQISFVPVDNSSGGVALDGFVTTDIRLDFMLGLSGSELIIELESGSFYRDPLGNPDGSRPNGGFFPSFPSLEFDTAIYGGGPQGIGALLLNGSVDGIFPSNGGMSLNQSWNAAGLDPASTEDVLDIRVTLSGDASGTFEYLTSTDGEYSFRQGTIVGGRLVPEPNSLLLTAFALLFGITSRCPRSKEREGNTFYTRSFAKKTSRLRRGVVCF